MCTQNTKTQRGRTHGAGCVWQWFRTAEPLGKRRYEDWNTHTLNLLSVRFVSVDIGCKKQRQHLVTLNTCSNTHVVILRYP